MKRTALFVLVVLGTVLLLGALPVKQFPYVSRALNKTRTISELELRILQKRIDTTPVPVPGGVFHVKKMDASAQRYALLVKVDVALNSGQKPIGWKEDEDGRRVWADRRVWAVIRPLYSLARARFGDNASFARGGGGLIVLVTMEGKPFISTAGLAGNCRLAPNGSPADIAKVISKYVEHFRANEGG